MPTSRRTLLKGTAAAAAALSLDWTRARAEAETLYGEALKGADAVLCTILAGGVDVWRHDIEIPKKYGVDTNVGDTRGPSGLYLRPRRSVSSFCVAVNRCKRLWYSLFQ